jgi:hypothetical protein
MCWLFPVHDGFLGVLDIGSMDQGPRWISGRCDYRNMLCYPNFTDRQTPHSAHTHTHTHQPTHKHLQHTVWVQAKIITLPSAHRVACCFCSSKKGACEQTQTDRTRCPLLSGQEGRAEHIRTQEQGMCVGVCACLSVRLEERVCDRERACLPQQDLILSM